MSARSVHEQAINSHSAVIVLLFFAVPKSNSCCVVGFIFQILYFLAFKFLYFPCIPCDCCYATSVWVLWTQYTPLTAFIGGEFLASVPKINRPVSSNTFPPHTYILSVYFKVPSPVL